MLICTRCKKEYKYKRGTNSSLRCASCVVNERRFKRKEKAVLYKGGKCEICGYNKCITAMAFHHKDPEQKDFSISGNHCRKWELVKQELNKCMLVCHNCHSEIHENTIKPRDMGSQAPHNRK